MATYVMMTRLRSENVTERRDYEALGERVAAKLKQECPVAHWLVSYAILGPSDYLDIFEAPDNDTAAQVALTAALREWKGVYNRVRPHQALGYRTAWG